MSTASASQAGGCLFRYSYLVGHDDTDESGVVHFTRYPALIETAALAGLESAGAGLTAMRDHGCAFAISELRVKYSAPAEFLDRLEIIASTDHVGLAHVRMAGAVRRGGDQATEPTLIASAQLIMAAIALATRSTSPLPGTVRTALLASMRQRGDPG